MWIVRLALKRPYTFVVMALAILVAGGLAIVAMPTDMFPDINIPVVSVIWTLGGTSPEEMADMITTRSERAFTTTVNDIEHMESQSIQGLGLMKIFFHPNAKVEAAVAQISAQASSMIHYLPPGIGPPMIIRYNASSVPILQLSISSNTIPEQELFDLTMNVIRTQMATVQGASFPLPYGGKMRQIMVDIDSQSLYSKGLSAIDVVNAINNQSVMQPAGTAKIGLREYTVRLNNVLETVKLFNNIPLKTSTNGVVQLSDVANVRDGFAVQTNIVRHDGRRSLLLTVLKNGGASTLDIVKRVQASLPRIQTTIPKEVKITTLFDQSRFVNAAIESVLKEAATAALLTGLMILLFLGSWRSTLIVCVSIPLSILTSLGVLYTMGHTINIMTLGGMALAVGILVDDATVEIENIHRNLGMGKPVVKAILDGAQQIAVPAFVSTLCICIVFVPVAFLTGAARYLFTPLALAVAIAMAASYLLSRTLVPTMVKYLIPAEVHRYRHAEDEEEAEQPGIVGKIHHLFNHWFELKRKAYRRVLASALAHRGYVLLFFGLLVIASGALVPLIGTDFFPKVDAGQIRLHVRAPAGTRLEETERLFALVEDSIRKTIPRSELKDILDNIGLPNSGMNYAFSDSVTVGPFDGEILVSLQEDHRPTGNYISALRKQLNKEYPELTFFFQPADIVSQILNFGIPAPVDIQVAGPLRNYRANAEIARAVRDQVTRLPGAVDVHLQQVDDMPELKINVDRTRARQLGMTQVDVARSMVVSLSSSSFVGTNWWLNIANGIDYLVAVQTPMDKIETAQDLLSQPVRSSNGQTQLLNNVATLERSTGDAVVSHYNVQPMINVQASVEGRDLGSFARDVRAILARAEPKLPAGSFFTIRGQVETMERSFVGMGFGIILAILLVYFVMVVNFQSWLDPFIILTALPGALSGILLMLFVTQTTISVPALMGAIMSIGVATANSILLVNFANDRRAEGVDANQAALDAGFTRLRPVIMTAAAMIVGMLPMALGIGEGGEQNAPLGRAVIGGLLVATVATLFFVPVVYSYLRKKAPVDFEAEVVE
jgi:multidrug efflux pump subunit AcrB